MNMKERGATTKRMSPVVMLVNLILSGLALAQGPAAPTGLMCELIAHPELSPIGDSTPEFSWIVGLAGRQTAYQILVASDRKSLDKDQGGLWDSGKIMSPRSTAIEYAGKPLHRNGNKLKSSN